MNTNDELTESRGDIELAAFHETLDRWEILGGEDFGPLTYARMTADLWIAQQVARGAELPAQYRMSAALTAAYVTGRNQVKILTTALSGAEQEAYASGWAEANRRTGAIRPEDLEPSTLRGAADDAQDDDWADDEDREEPDGS